MQNTFVAGCKLSSKTSKN